MSILRVRRRGGQYHEVLLDDQDMAEFGYLTGWHMDNDGYVIRCKKGQPRQLLHRLIMGATERFAEMVDHINGNKLDNRRSNLRFCNKSTNGMNRGPAGNNTTGYKGVSALGTGYRATINRDGHQYHLGMFSTAKEAACAYMGAAIILHGEFAGHLVADTVHLGHESD